MRTIKTLLIVFLVMSSKKSFSQQCVINKEQTAFLIGMFEDDFGRFIKPKDPIEKCLITLFWDKSVLTIFMDSLNSFTKKESKDFETTDESLFYSVHSCKYVNYFNSYYKFKNAGIIPRLGGIEKYKSFVGRLNTKKFVSTKEKLSFLSGSFLRYGKISNDGLYFYKYDFSLTHFNTVEQFLKETNSIIVEKINTLGKNYQLIRFNPSKDLKYLLDKLPVFK